MHSKRYYHIAVNRMLVFCLLLAVLTKPAIAAVSPDSEIQRDMNRIFSEKIKVTGFPYEELIKESADRYGLPFPYVLAVARGESFFDPGAKSTKGAVGIMQVMPETAKGEYGIPEEALLDPAVNIDAGTHYLSDLYDRFKDPYLTLAAYACGPDNVDVENFLVDKECNEYVKYIHTHLTTILAQAEGKIPPTEGKLQKLVITHFDNYLNAKGFLDFINPRLGNFKLDVFRTEVQMKDHLRLQYQIIAAHGEETSKQDICGRIKEISGFSLCDKS